MFLHKLKRKFRSKNPINSYLHVLHIVLHALKFCAIYLRNVLHFSLVLGILIHHLMGSGQWLCMAKSFKVSALEVIWFDGLWKMDYRFWFQTWNSFFLDTAVIKFRSETGTFLLDSIIHLYNLNLILQFSNYSVSLTYTSALFYLALFKVRDPTGSGAIRTWIGGSRAGISNFGLNNWTKPAWRLLAFPLSLGTDGFCTLSLREGRFFCTNLLHKFWDQLDKIIVAKKLMTKGIWLQSPSFKNLRIDSKEPIPTGCVREA